MLAPAITKPLLEVNDLVVDFSTRGGRARVVDGVNFTVAPGEAVGIVGESGCGKSVSMLSLLGLLPPGARVSGGEAHFEGSDLLQLDAHHLRQVRGNRIGMIFQDPLTSLNPVMRVGAQLGETLVAHRRMSRAEARAEAGRLLSLVGIPGGAERLDDFPHQLSGGMRQRVMIAMSVACNPALLIADEPTTALDVTIQRQVVDLITNLRHEMGMAVIWISHDLSLLSRIVDRVAVFYAGHVVEEGPVEKIYRTPQHPYTQGLIASIPGLASLPAGHRLYSIPGVPPFGAERPKGCPFAPRCARRLARCIAERPVLGTAIGGQRAACFVAQAEIAA
jgi:peptide/nickel transport system ATP-binding protein